MTGPVILRRGRPADHRIARTDRLLRRALGAYGLTLVAITSWVQLCWHG